MTTTLKLWCSTIKTTFTNLRALVVFAVLYAILLATFFRFIWIREATLWQVLFTYAFMILIPAEFFVFQASIINRARAGKFHWRTILIDAGAKLFLRRIASALSRAFSSESVLIYALGLIVSLVLPYIILIPTFAIKNNKTEFTVFILRLVVSFVFTLIGWVVTMSALV